MRESVTCFFYGFWGDFAHIEKSFGNPLRSRSKHKNPNSQRSRPQIKISEGLVRTPLVTPEIVRNI